RRGRRGVESARDARGGGSARRRPNILGSACGALVVALLKSWSAGLRIIIALPPPHVVVGLFIVNNRPETMAHRFLQPPVSIAMLACTGVVAGAGRHRLAVGLLEDRRRGASTGQTAVRSSHRVLATPAFIPRAPARLPLSTDSSVRAGKSFASAKSTQPNRSRDSEEPPTS